MLIEALVTIITPHPNGPPKTVANPPGSVVNIPDEDEAKALIARKFAKPAASVAAVAIREDVVQSPADAPLAAPTPPAAVAPGGAPAAPDAAPPDATAAPGDGGGGEGGGDAEVMDAFELLEKDNADHWTADGRPDVRALSAIVGRTVKAADRDRLWAEWKAAHAD